MRGKRSKQYRKLMQQYGLHFGFREPYQVLLDADILLDAARFRMDFLTMLSRTLHGEVKPMITHCCMRHLYTAEPKNELVIEHAKNFEKRRCNHHTLEQPLSALECISSIVDPKGSRTNKNRYIIASQSIELQELMKSIPGVPLIFLLRSVMIMKPMSDATAQTRSREEQVKFSSGIKGSRTPGLIGMKRKVILEEATKNDQSTEANVESPANGENVVKKKRKRGPKGPNPLSVKKAKKSSDGESLGRLPAVSTMAGTDEALHSSSTRRKRR